MALLSYPVILTRFTNWKLCLNIIPHSPGTCNKTPTSFCPSFPLLLYGDKPSA